MYFESDARRFAECVDNLELCVEVGDVVGHKDDIVCIPFARYVKLF